MARKRGAYPKLTMVREWGFLTMQMDRVLPCFSAGVRPNDVKLNLDELLIKEVYRCK